MIPTAGKKGAVNVCRYSIVGRQHSANVLDRIEYDELIQSCASPWRLISVRVLIIFVRGSMSCLIKCNKSKTRLIVKLLEWITSR